ncbi:MAG: DUF3313 family protein [Xanthomonadales bacterium]
MATNHALLRLLPTAVLLFAPAAMAATADADNASGSEGLQRVEKDARGAIYAQPDVDWSSYDSILLEDATVAFRKNWLRDQNRSRRSLTERVGTDDVERIKTGLSKLFNEVFVDELSRNGAWSLVEEAGPNVLRIRPQIVDLDVRAPDVRGTSYSRSYTDSSGEMTLKLELYDSETGDLIAAASDRRESPYRGYMQWTTSVSNAGDARQIVQQWARALNERLTEATRDRSQQ